MGKNWSGKIFLILKNIHGNWYSVAAGDFDKDGDEDYVLGNIGNNHRFSISDKYPLNLYAIDLELDGTLDPIITGYWNDRNEKMAEYPVNYLDDLREESTFFQIEIQ